MIKIDDAALAQLKVAKIMAVAMFIAAPLVYLGVGYVINKPPMAGGEGKLLFYILFIVALVQPLTLPLIERTQIKNYHANPRSQMTPAQSFLMVSITKFALVEAIFLYGLLVRILLGNFNYMLYFYAVGIIWARIYWPRMSTMEKYLEKVEQHDLNVTGR